MRKVTFLFLASTLMAMSCNSSQNLVNIQPQMGNLEIPAKGELRVWKDLKHASFDVVLTNANTAQSCEAYYVKRDGTEKWISPSLLANSKLTVHIPSDGHLFLKNFNPNTFTIAYEIKK